MLASKGAEKLAGQMEHMWVVAWVGDLVALWGISKAEKKVPLPVDVRAV